jgi:hypothetical protein
MRASWIGVKDFHNLQWTKRTSSRKGDEKGEKGVFWGSYSCVIFLGKGRRRMMSLSRWWKKGGRVGCWGTLKE